MEEWIERPDIYYPPAPTTGWVIKWTFAIKRMIDSGDPECKLLMRYRAYMDRLKDRDIAKVKTIMLIGRELWNLDNKGYSRYLEELETLPLIKINKWMKVFEVTDSYGDYKQFRDYYARDLDIDEILNGCVYLQAYLDFHEEIKKEVISMDNLSNYNSITYLITIDDASCNPLYEMIVEKDDPEKELQELSVVVSWLIRNDIRFTLTYEDNTSMDVEYMESLDESEDDAEE